MVIPTAAEEGRTSEREAQLPEATPRHSRLTAIIAWSTGAILALMVALGWFIGDYLAELRLWVERLGSWGVLLFVFAYVFWTLTTITSIPLMTLAGLLFGEWMGAAWSLVGATIGASATFWIGRVAARRRVVIWRQRYQRVGRLMDLVERHPYTAVLLVRALAVFPLTLLNYGFGTTKIRFARYLAISILMTLPGVALYTGVGNIIGLRVVGESVSAWNVVWVVVFGLISLGVAIAIKRRRLRFR